MTVTHAAEATEAALAALVEPEVPCATIYVSGALCEAVAVWDLLWVCDAGCEGVTHACGEHKTLWLSMALVRRLRCAKHPAPRPAARYVAVFPRGRS